DVCSAQPLRGNLTRGRGKMDHAGAEMNPPMARVAAAQEVFRRHRPLEGQEAGGRRQESWLVPASGSTPSVGAGDTARQRSHLDSGEVATPAPAMHPRHKT